MANHKDVSEYENTINALERSQRNDLAVHLYSAFLSHRVNPYFPPSGWSSWPKHRTSALDPRVREYPEDIIVSDSEYSDAPKQDIPKHQEPLAEEVQLRFRRSRSRVSLGHKRQRISSPRATLVNEIGSILENKIKQEVLRQGHSVEEMVFAGESALVRDMAIRIAGRLNRVLAAVDRQKHPSAASSLKDWQNVLLASLQNDRVDGYSDLACVRRNYEALRKLFFNAKYHYEYDPDDYCPKAQRRLANAMPAQVPVFDVEQNLLAIEEQGLAPADKEPALDEIERREDEFRFKENLFVQLWDDIAREKQLSWHDQMEPTATYAPDGDRLQKERQEIFKDVRLKAQDFQYHFTQ